MKADLWKRLDSIGRGLGAGDQVITVLQYFDETEDDANKKLAQWRAGDDTKDVVARPSSGDELVIQIMRFGRKSDGSEVTGEEYAGRY